jgi:predicted transcriptional regulator/2-polyprenyl-3-methyl-5-hydroxy-6-metoxy-1,4-benzoquinol methylase
MEKTAINSDLVYDSYVGGFLGQITRIALILDVFSPLSESPTNAEKIASECNSNVECIRAVLDYLSSTGVMFYHPISQTYELTPSAAAFMVRKEKTYAGDWVLANTDPVLVEKMLETIQSGDPMGHTLPWDQDAWLESYSPTRVAYSLDLWQSVGVNIDMDRPFHILDLASGCGIKTMAFARENPSVRVTCLDREDVLEVARDLANRMCLGSRVSFQTADILSDDFGINEYEAVLLGLITYILTPEQNIEVFLRAHQALKRGGKLVIDAIMSPEEPSEWANRVTLLMKTLNGGAAHSFSEYRTWLEFVGYSEVVYHNEQLLSAIK